MKAYVGRPGRAQVVEVLERAADRGENRGLSCVDRVE
ncbi:MAG: hypothetical protein SV966_06705 [Actinomycetota bacterium]|nr:hypothetical protein [Actinomycetota bacterium]